MGRALAWLRGEPRKFLLSSSNSIILSTTEEGLTAWKDSQWESRDRGKGFF